MHVTSSRADCFPSSLIYSIQYEKSNMRIIMFFLVSALNSSFSIACYTVGMNYEQTISACNACKPLLLPFLFQNSYIL